MYLPNPLKTSYFYWAHLYWGTDWAKNPSRKWETDGLGGETLIKLSWSEDVSTEHTQPPNMIDNQLAILVLDLQSSGLQGKPLTLKFNEHFIDVREIADRATIFFTALLFYSDSCLSKMIMPDV